MTHEKASKRTKDYMLYYNYYLNANPELPHEVIDEMVKNDLK